MHHCHICGHVFSPCVGRTAGDARVASRNLTTAEQAEGVACYEGLSLIHNTTYVSTLSFYNGAMDPSVTVAATDGGTCCDASIIMYVHTYLSDLFYQV